MNAPLISVLLLDGDQATEAALVAPGLAPPVRGRVEQAGQHDAVVWCAETPDALRALSLRGDLTQAAFDSALVVLAGHADEALEAELLGRGVEAILLTAHRAALPRTLRHAVLRKRVERAARTAYATDLATGLPHQAQLLEHMTQLLALREREPAPMVLLVLRVEGYAGAAARLGGEAANVLRRKVAVRLRSGLRASDVVAAIGPESFGVLLGRLESRGDGERVAAKLVRTLQQPIMVAGQACNVSSSVGLAIYPDHGKDAHTLLQRASAQAGSVATLGREGFAARTERGAAAAANDDESDPPS
jgi:diguanylate cyclase (GGDEF)-like protein